MPSFYIWGPFRPLTTLMYNPPRTCKFVEASTGHLRSESTTPNQEKSKKIGFLTLVLSGEILLQRVGWGPNGPQHRFRVK